MTTSRYLVDTNILVRMFDNLNPKYPIARKAVDSLALRNMDLAYTMQNMAEFWNVSTRPKQRNGFGLTVGETENNARKIERGFTFLPDTADVYREWSKLVFESAFPACRCMTRGLRRRCTRTASPASSPSTEATSSGSRASAPLLRTACKGLMKGCC